MKKAMKRRFAAKLWTIARFILQAAKQLLGAVAGMTQSAQNSKPFARSESGVGEDTVGRFTFRVGSRSISYTAPMHYNLWRLHDPFRPVRELDQCVIPDVLHCDYVIQIDVDGL
jgi:hypothetical protein